MTDLMLARRDFAFNFISAWNRVGMDVGQPSKVKPLRWVLDWAGCDANVTSRCVLPSVGITCMEMMSKPHRAGMFPNVGIQNEFGSGGMLRGTGWGSCVPSYSSIIESSASMCGPM
mgnify:CR=1 FL=1